LPVHESGDIGGSLMQVTAMHYEQTFAAWLPLNLNFFISAMSAFCGLLPMVGVTSINPLRPPELSLFFVVLSHYLSPFLQCYNCSCSGLPYHLIIFPFPVTYSLLVCTLLTRHIL